MSWIAMRTDLLGDPSTLTISDRLNIPPEHAVGLLHKLWCWADAQLTDGNAPTVTKTSIDRYIGVSGFADAVQQAGWLVDNGDGISIPNFDHWMSQSAKYRLKSHQRVQKHRAKPCNAPTITKALLHNNTIHNKETLSTKSRASPKLKPRKDSRETEHAKALGRALCEATGFVPKAGGDHARITKLVKVLIEHEATPEQIPIRAKRYAAEWSDVKITPEGLVKHWGSFSEVSKVSSDSKQSNWLGKAVAKDKKYDAYK